MREEEEGSAEVQWLAPQAAGASPPARWDVSQADPLAVPPGRATPPPPPAPWVGAAVGRRSNSAALVSLCCGIGGLILFLAGGFGLVFVLNLPCSVLAWAMGVQGKRQVDRGQTSERRGMAQAGLVLGVVGTVLGVLALIGWILAFALSAEFRHEFQRQLEKNQSALLWLR